MESTASAKARAAFDLGVLAIQSQFFLVLTKLSPPIL
jgi:hypothetical protein